ncbi:ead/Ea22-like family protein [Enterobacter hormaechei]|uniref:ead/Ea22-like family protein n=1 Tax=Enterobacter hormaechei TaxID=158836 RepID=UPI001E3C7898|nr:ead/Ea22-like family protein [Enterobacter hormaechei]
MSNIDKRALREAANAANAASWGNWESYKPHKGARGYEVKVGVKAVAQHCLKVDSVFIAAANPATVLALLDELEAKDNRINRLEAIVAVAEQLNVLMREWKRAMKVPCDLVDDQVPVVIHGMVIRLERLKETEDKLTAAEKRIAELEAREVKPVAWMRSANVTSFMSRFTTNENYAVEQWGDDAVALYSLPVDYIPACFTDERNLMHINERGRETSLIWSEQNSDSDDIQLFRIAAAAGKGE